jgi:preprotein translocase subunit YajC
LNLVFLLADAAATHPALEPVPFWANPQNMIMILIFGIFAFLMLSSSRSKRAEQKTRDDMLKNLKRNDRVQTAGGILGSVVEVRDDEVVLKVDESSNTKIKFSRDAIRKVLVDSDTLAMKK